jgi:hypothetical protein
VRPSIGGNRTAVRRYHNAGHPVQYRPTAAQAATRHAVPNTGEHEPIVERDCRAADDRKVPWLGDLDSNQGCPGQSREFYR